MDDLMEWGVTAGFCGMVLTFLYGLVLRFTVLNEMDRYMSVGRDAWRRRGPRKVALMPFSFDVIFRYAAASGTNKLWTRTFPDLDRQTVPAYLRNLFAGFFYGFVVFFIPTMALGAWLMLFGPDAG